MTDSHDCEYRLDNQIGFLLRRAHQYASLVFQKHIPPASLTPPQFSALFVIYKNKDITQNKLGRMIDTDAATIQGIVKRLVERGYVERSLDETHRRKLKLRLSPAGLKTLMAAIPSAHHISEITLKELSKHERDQLLALLAKMVGRRDKALQQG